MQTLDYQPAPISDRRPTEAPWQPRLSCFCSIFCILISVGGCVFSRAAGLEFGPVPLLLLLPAAVILLIASSLTGICLTHRPRIRRSTLAALICNLLALFTLAWMAYFDFVAWAMR